jgi:multidrug efflux pump subunit AcrB
MKLHKTKEFKPTSWAIDNKTSIYVLVFIICLFGVWNYNTIPKEQFPEIVIPTILVNTIYPGTSPNDMESLISRPIEKNIKSISGVKKITSNSIQDFSSIAVEFNTGIDVAEAKQKVKDAVDKTKSQLPNDLPADPAVREIDMSEIPIMYLNISGNYPLDRLKKYAEVLQDKIESLKEITRVDIVGALSREIQINVDMYKMQMAGGTFSDIERAISVENMTISGGTIDMQGMTRSIRVTGEFKDIETIKNINFKSSAGALLKLSDIAEVKDSFKKQESFARLNNNNVITLNVVKKGGQNLLDASDNIKEIIEDLQKEKLPKDLNITVSGEQSRLTRNTLADLNNTIIIGFILVTIILMFFMGLTNAVFVGLAVPLSMAIAYIVMPGFDFTMNMLVMFSFIFALGIVVDDAIVVIENTHRIFNQHKGKMSISTAAKTAAGEVFVPILSGTLTTIAPFFPLLFWPGTVGSFMYFIPATLIITLTASLFVAYIINPVFAVNFMTHDNEEDKLSKKRILRNTLIITCISLPFYIFQVWGIGNFIVFMAILYLFHMFIGQFMILKFQKNTLPKILTKYENILRWSLSKRRPTYLMFGLIGLFILTIVITSIKKPKVVFFPDNQPSNIFVLVKMPVGTSVIVTDSVTRIVEQKVFDVIGKDNKIVESVISNVALGASSNAFDFGTITPNQGKVTVNFVEFSKRNGENTSEYLDLLSQSVKNISGAQISVEKSKMGPPTGKPVNIEISGENLDELIETSIHFKRYLDSLNIKGIELLKSDFEQGKPEIIIDIDRERANREGIMTGQVGGELRTAVFGKEITKFREGEDQYPVQLRYSEEIRDNIDKLLNHRITYRDMSSGMFRSIPLSSVAKIRYQNTFGGIKRYNLKRVITLSSDVTTGYTANEIVAKINQSIPGFSKSEGIEIKLTGEQEDQKESMGFLSKAMILALLLIFFILITQFNSFGKTVIILSEVIFSIIGVLLGFILFDMTISIIMTGLGIVALGGIVVRNGILLVEFTDVLKERGLKTREAIIQAGKTRITPVLLTASATIIGLVPLGIGLNIDFVSLFSHFDPKIHLGGDNVMFFGPLAWTIIFGLTFATFLTLIMIPVMYDLMYASKVKIKRGKSNRTARRLQKAKV